MKTKGAHYLCQAGDWLEKKAPINQRCNQQFFFENETESNLWLLILWLSRKHCCESDEPLTDTTQSHTKALGKVSYWAILHKSIVQFG